ncbi:MAG: ATP12 family protein, partial [Nisaea sp.]
MKRFYEAASVEKADGGYQVLLDDRPVRTPAKAPLLLPVEELAAKIAAEWNAQG